MPHRRITLTALGALALVALALVPTGCRAEATPEPLANQIEAPRQAPVIPSATAVPTTEAQATQAARATYAAMPAASGTLTPTGETRLPAEPDTVVVQLARIEPSPWEPDILAHMAPHFSLQASGYGVFRYVGGPSEWGWYQTVITPTDTLDFLKLLMDDIDVLDLAKRHGVGKVHFETGKDGKAAGSGVIGVIYVRSADREGRLVIAEKDMESPDPADPDAARLKKLHEVVKWIEIWKTVVERPFTPDYVALGDSILTWWTDKAFPYTPTSAVAFGTGGRSRVAGDAPIADWPLEKPLSDVVKASYGDKPDEIRLEGSDLAAVLAGDNARERARLGAFAEGQKFWGPLWRDKGEAARYLVGVRAAVPGSNHVVIAYEYVVPKRGIALSASGR
jgi:hypothetical protein